MVLIIYNKKNYDLFKFENVFIILFIIKQLDIILSLFILKLQMVLF